MRVKDFSVPLLFVVTAIIGLFVLVWLLPSTPQVGTAIGTQNVFVDKREKTSLPFSAAHSLYIPSPGLSGDFDGLTIYFDEETIVNNRIKVILDGELYWIRLERGVYP